MFYFYEAYAEHFMKKNIRRCLSIFTDELSISKDINFIFLETFFMQKQLRIPFVFIPDMMGIAAANHASTNILDIFTAPLPMINGAAYFIKHGFYRIFLDLLQVGCELCFQKQTR